MKKLILALVITLLPWPALAASFSDVPESSSYYAIVESMKNLKIMSGNKDGTFGLNKGVSRAEALKMVFVAAKITDLPTPSGAVCLDVAADAWYAKYVLKAQQLGVVKTKSDGKWKPGEPITKADFLKLLLLTFKKDLSNHKNLKYLSKDTNPKEWYAPYLSYAKTIGLIAPTIQDKLEPFKNLTRIECADILYKFLLIERSGSVQKLLNMVESNLVDAIVKLNSNDVDSAIAKANDAVMYSEKALEKKKDSKLVKAANKIALGFKKLCLAYQAGIAKDFTKLKTLASEAKALATEAKNLDSSVNSLSQKIGEMGDVLVNQTK